VYGAWYPGDKAKPAHVRRSPRAAQSPPREPQPSRLCWKGEDAASPSAGRAPVEALVSLRAGASSHREELLRRPNPQSVRLLARGGS
jgi:hypothetical protein